MDKNALAKTPPMGWNSWDCYGAGVTESVLLANADFMARKLKKFGWQYVVCDIQWYEPNARGVVYNDYAPLVMDGLSRLLPAENRFPSSANGQGFKVIAEKIHAMGLKFGVHVMRGIPRQAVEAATPIAKAPFTAADIADKNSYCTWNTDMYGVNPLADGAYEYYLSVFTLFAEWGVDFVKVDDICNTELFPDKPYSAQGEIELIRRALDNCGRDMVLSLSPGPAPIEYARHLSTHANMWRLTGDFWDKWEKLKAMFDYCASWYPYVKEGCWPDCDMLPIGRIRILEKGDNANALSRFTPAEQVTLLSLWCIFRSPLFIGGELTDDLPAVMRLLTNEEILTMHREGQNPRPLPAKKHVRLWRSASKRYVYLALFNTSRLPKTIVCKLSEADAANAESAIELWENKSVAIQRACVKCRVAPHGAAVLRLTMPDTE